MGGRMTQETHIDYWRQMDIVRPGDDLNFPVSVIGCGGIGSPTALALAKMGVNNIRLYDPDILENHNLPNQIYRLEDITKYKVEALAGVLQSFAGIIPTVFNTLVNGNHRFEGVVVSGVDSMSSRQEIWKAIKFKPNVSLYVDGRMGAEACRIYTIRPVDPNDVKFYETFLYNDENAQELPCTGRAIIYNVFMIASLICNQIKKFARGEPFHKEIIFDMVTFALINN
jgi:hypothetical protein